MEQNDGPSPAPSQRELLELEDDYLAVLELTVIFSEVELCTPLPMRVLTGAGCDIV